MNEINQMKQLVILAIHEKHQLLKNMFLEQNFMLKKVIEEPESAEVRIDNRFARILDSDKQRDDQLCEL